MPFGLGMPQPSPDQFDTSWIDQIFAGSQPSQANPQLDALKAGLGQLDQSFQPEAVPGTVNPFAQMAGTFASSLAGMLGNQGAPQAFQQQVQGAQEAHQGAQSRNKELAHQKQIARLEYTLKIGEAEQEQADKLGDWKTAKQLAKTNFGTQARIHKMEEDQQVLKDQAMLGRQLAVAKEKGSQSRLTNAARQTLVNRYGQDPRAKLILQQSDDQAALISARYNEMLKANAAARSTYQEIPYSEAELETARLDADTKMSSLYTDALEHLGKLNAGAPAGPVAAPVKGNPTAHSFWTKP